MAIRTIELFKVTIHVDLSPRSNTFYFGELDEAARFRDAALEAGFKMDSQYIEAEDVSIEPRSLASFLNVISSDLSADPTGKFWFNWHQNKMRKIAAPEPDGSCKRCGKKLGEFNFNFFYCAKCQDKMAIERLQKKEL